MSAVSEQIPVVTRERRQRETVREQASPSNAAATTSESKSWLRQKLRWFVIGGVGVVALGAVIALVARGMGEPNQQLVFYTVKRGDVQIKVTERGALESQENIEVICEVDDIDGDGLRGVPIEWIVRNGATVKKGDLIVEFAGAGHQERYDRQILDAEQAKSVQIQANAKYENQITQNLTTRKNAELQVKLAELELKMYTDAESGTHQLEVEEIERLIDDVNNEILAAQATMELKSNEKRGAEELFKLGYAGRSEVEQYRLDYLQAEGTFASKVNKLRTQLATLKKKKTFEREMQVLTLDGSQETAKRNLEQVIRDNEALLEQASAAKDAADEGRRKEEERLARYKKYMDNCKIYAPADGMVAYAVADARAYWLDEIREGATVRQRQHILSLPNLKLMQVKTSIHESMLEQVQPGLTASIRMEAFPDRQYEGKVKSIAVLAGGQGSDTKVYDTIVTIDGEVEGLRPGMTAVVDIRVARLKDVLSVPVQAITQVDDETFCYVESGRDVERRVLKLGRTNDKFVEVKEGLEEGDRVVLNPMSILEEEEKDKNELSPEDEFDLDLEGNDDTESNSDATTPPATQSSPSDRTGNTSQQGSSQRKAGDGAGSSGRTKSSG